MKTFSLEHVDIANWIRIQINEACARMNLRQRIGDGEAHVREYPLAANSDADALAEEVMNKVYEEARVLRGPTTYALFSYKAGALSHCDRKFLRVEGMSGSSDVLVGETEAPDGKGLVSQMMRHTEASAKIGLGQTLAIVEHYKQILRERDARIATLEAMHNEVMAQREEVLSMQHERHLEMVREQRVERKEAFMRQKLDMLAPVIMSKLLGAGAPNGKGSMLGEELLRQFLKSLSPEQIGSMTGALNPEQVVTLHEIFTRYSDREEERAKAEGEGSAEGAGGGALADGAGGRTSDAGPSGETETTKKEKT